MDILKKRENEDKFEYGLRILEAKCQKELDLSWEEIVDLLDLGVHRDTIRKAMAVGEYSGYNIMQYYKQKIEDLSNENSDNVINELIFELEQKKNEIKKERIKLSTMRSELNKAIREESRKELFYENLREEIRNNSLVPPRYVRNECEYNEKEYVQLIADVHYGSTFNIGINEYSIDICEERFEQMYSDMYNFVVEKEISHLYVASLGDLIQSILRISDLKLNSISTVEQIYGISHIIASYLNALSEIVDVTYLHTINANHSELRLLGSKSGELQEDVELLIGNWIKDLLINNDRVEVIVAEETVMDLQLFDYNIALLHGQNIKNRETFLRDLSLMKGKKYDYVLYGHIHHYTVETVSMGNTGNTCQMISCPSLVGACAYSKKLLKTAPSGFVVLGFEENKGKTETYEFNLE